MTKGTQNFFEKQWVKWSGIIGVFGVGYACGSYKESLDSKVEQMKIIQEYNEKLNSEEVLCKTATIVGLKNDITELKEATKILKKQKNEK